MLKKFEDDSNLNAHHALVHLTSKPCADGLLFNQQSLNHAFLPAGLLFIILLLIVSVSQVGL